MCAVFIIGTSLAPSPIANVILFNCLRTSLTTSAFWLGNNLQHTTASQFLAMLASSIDAAYDLRMGVKSLPSISNPFATWSFVSLLLCSTSYFSFATIASSFASFSGLYFITSKLLCIKLQLLAMFSAVSILSPVNIHTFISILNSVYLLEVSHE